MPLPAGLLDGSRMDGPIFTPVTKAELGEDDENVTFEHVAATIGAEEPRGFTPAVVDFCWFQAPVV